MMPEASVTVSDPLSGSAAFAAASIGSQSSLGADDPPMRRPCSWSWRSAASAEANDPLMYSASTIAMFVARVSAVLSARSRRHNRSRISSVATANSTVRVNAMMLNFGRRRKAAAIRDGLTAIRTSPGR
jgi:hypothetical protein